MSITESVSHRMPGRIQEFALNQAKRFESRKVGNLVDRLNKNPELLPNHVLLIPDGNRRFARNHGQGKEEGHQKGAQAIYDAFDALSNLQIPNVTGWALSTDNFESRDPAEIEYLQDLLIRFTRKIVPDLKDKNSRFIHLGRRDRIRGDLADELTEAEAATRNNTG